MVHTIGECFEVSCQVRERRELRHFGAFRGFLFALSASPAAASWSAAALRHGSTEGGRVREDDREDDVASDADACVANEAEGAEEIIPTRPRPLCK